MLPSLGRLECLPTRIPLPFAEYIFRTRFGEYLDFTQTSFFFLFEWKINGFFFQADQEIPKMSTMNEYDVDGMPLEDPELDGAPLSDSEDLDGNDLFKTDFPGHLSTCCYIH